MIAFYCRLSVADRTGCESDSIANQRMILSDFVASRDDLGDEGHLFFVDDGISGTHAENRPALQRMLGMCRDGLISAVVVKDLSRLSRDGLYCVGLVEDELPSLGVRVISVTDGYDSKFDGKSPSASTELGFRAIMNAWYSKDLSRKVTQSIESERAAGANLTTVPFGYRKERGARTCEVDEEGAAVVRRIFGLACEGLDQARIAAALNEEGAVTPHNLRAARSKGGGTRPKPNQRWTGTMVKTVVRNPHYKGTLVLGKRKRVEMGLPASRPTEPGERLVFEGAHEAIVDAGTWERAQGAMRDTGRGGRTEPLGHPFSGLIFCPRCGAAVPFRSRAQSPVERYTAYCGCFPEPPSIALADLEAAVGSVLRAHAGLALGLSGALAASEAAPERAEALRAELERLSARKLRAYEAYRSGGLSAEGFSAESGAIRAREAEARRDLELLEDEAARRAPDVAEARRAAEIARRLGSGGATREAIEALVERVELMGDDDVRVTLRYADLFERVLGSPRAAPPLAGPAPADLRRGR